MNDTQGICVNAINTPFYADGKSGNAPGIRKLGR